MRNMLNQLNIDIDDNKLHSLNRIENFRGIEVIFNKQDTTIGYMLQDKLFKLFYIDKNIYQNYLKIIHHCRVLLLLLYQFFYFHSPMNQNKLYAYL